VESIFTAEEIKMHDGAFEFVRRFSTDESLTVIEIGSMDINGSVRPCFPNASWIGIDVAAGPGVDIVIDAIDYSPECQADLVICTEVLEHTDMWCQIISRAETWIKPGGRIIITCAGTGRLPHSAVDGGPVQAGEHYANITHEQLAAEFQNGGFTDIHAECNQEWKDSYAVATKANEYAS
jgi:hypothetical protein